MIYQFGDPGKYQIVINWIQLGPIGANPGQSARNHTKTTPGIGPDFGRISTGFWANPGQSEAKETPIDYVRTDWGQSGQIRANRGKSGPI